jgi:FAD/FMN-containing dehydrogenase
MNASVPRTELTRALAGHVRGEVRQPADPGYDAARAIWNARIDRMPSVIVRATGKGDVIAGVNVAREHGVPLSVRGGGHHVAGHAVCDGGVMLDLSLLNDVQVDAVAQRAWVGPGARVREVDQATQAFGLVTTGAPVSMVGVAGYTLGGGLGWTSRMHGLSCDNLVSAEVVTAAGELVHVSDEQNRDLFWALRGGSGNFGVVISFEFRLHQLGPEVLAGAIVHPMNSAPWLLRFWRDFMRDAPDELQCMPVIFPLPPSPGGGQGETVLALVALYAGGPAEAAEVVAPLREAGNPLSDGVSVVRYAGLLASLDEMYRAGHRVCYRTAFFDDIPDAAIDAFLERAAPVPTPFSSIFLEPMRGAIARRARDATAFAHRDRMFCVTAVPKWDRAARDAEMIAWADALFESLAPYAAEGAYVNYLDGDGEARARAAYGEHWDRLVELKKKWDPDNLFRMNHNIPPGR